LLRLPLGHASVQAAAEEVALGLRDRHLRGYRDAEASQHLADPGDVDFDQALLGRIARDREHLLGREQPLSVFEQAVEERAPATWSSNQTSAGEGFCIVRGVPALTG
jgi:hypothetical protein